MAVYAWVKQNIQNNTFKSGEKLISENKLCEKFSISRPTARQAIALLEKENLVIRKRGSGTFVNHPIIKKQTTSKTIGLLMTYIDGYIFPDFISGVEQVLSKHSYHMALRLTSNQIQNERQQLLSFLDMDIDGLIVEGVKSALPNPNLELYQQLYNRHIPVIFINSYYPTLDCNYILNDDYIGGRLATRHLIENGHKKIAIIFKHDDLQGTLRYKGFLDEMYDQHLEVNESFIFWYSTESYEQLFRPEHLLLLIDKLRECSAAVCYNDQLVFRLIPFLTQAKLNIPKDLSITSFDNSSVNDLASVPLSSVTHPGEELSKLATTSLLTMIENPHFEIKHVYQPSIIIRDSVQPYVPKHCNKD